MSNQKFCSECGTPNEADAVFCVKEDCGHVLEDVPQSSDSETPIPVPVLVSPEKLAEIVNENYIQGADSSFLREVEKTVTGSNETGTDMTLPSHNGDWNWVVSSPETDVLSEAGSARMVRVTACRKKQIFQLAKSTEYKCFRDCVIRHIRLRVSVLVGKAPHTPTPHSQQPSYPPQPQQPPHQPQPQQPPCPPNVQQPHKPHEHVDPPYPPSSAQAPTQNTYQYSYQNTNVTNTANSSWFAQFKSAITYARSNDYPGKTFSTIGLICGIVSLAFFFVEPLAPIVALIGLILCIKGKRLTPPGVSTTIATTGIVLCCLREVMLLIAIIGLLGAIASMG
jgi:hypothetical protein